jgi:hypothetical protein
MADVSSEVVAYHVRKWVSESVNVRANRASFRKSQP